MARAEAGILALCVLLLGGVAQAAAVAPVDALEPVRLAIRQKQFSDAFSRLEGLSEKGNAEAQYLLGSMLLANPLGEPDVKGASRWLSHEQTPYVASSKRSRGLIVLDFLEFSMPSKEFENYDLEGIEPFTMVLYDKGDLLEFRWDKKEKHLKNLDDQKPYIWSSATLYSNDAKTLRQSWFEDYLKQQKSHTQEAILHFHQNAGIGDKKNDLIMDRGMVKTVSITSIAKTENALKMEYFDLVNGGTSAFEYSNLI